MRHRWVVKRFITAVLTIFVVLSVTFFLIRLMPGNPVDVMIFNLTVSGQMTPRQVMEYIEFFYEMMPNEPYHIQYINYVRGIFQGSLGRSIFIYPSTPVLDLIVIGLPWTIFVVSISQIISFSIGALLGMTMAYRRRGKFDSIASGVFSVFSAIPPYVVGLLLLVFLAIIWPIFPCAGSYSRLVRPGWNLPFIVDILYHAALPIATYVLIGFGGWAITMKNATISVLGEDYVMAAEARGLKKQRVTRTYVGRNAMLPLFAGFAVSVGYSFGGAVFIEQIFSYFGVGYLANVALSSYDYPILQGVFLITTITVVVANFIADISYSILDPRIRLGD